MNLEDGVADLHLHTTASDGTSTVDERVEQATALGLEAIAITDHDCIDDSLDGRVANCNGLDVITGVEARTDYDGVKVELLGYFVDPTNPTLASLLNRARNFRHERNVEIIDRIDDETGLELSYDEMQERTRGMVGRPHFARRLVEEGIVESVGAAFGQYLGDDGSCYIPMTRVDYRRAIDAIHGAGGVTSIAHPGRIRSDEVSDIVRRFAEFGVDGIEVWYPYAEHPNMAIDFDCEAAQALATEYDLLRTGGSDCHDWESDRFSIGSVRTPHSDLDALRRRAEDRRSFESMA
jgi:hypothetical protein